MGKKGGVRQQLIKDDEIIVDADDDNNAGSTMRSYATGGRKRARDVGDFLSSMYLIGRLSAPELQEGAAAAIRRTGPSS